jgi:hypothetical protein
MTGAEFYYPSFFSINGIYPDPKNWIWQAASVGYARPLHPGMKISCVTENS